MAYDDWSPEFRELFDTTPGIRDVEPWEESHVEALFEAGFTYRGTEYEAQGLSPEQVEAIRDEFFTYMGLGENGELFDWDEWREAMNY
jgi:hypothetical protein